MKYVLSLWDRSLCHSTAVFEIANPLKLGLDSTESTNRIYPDVKLTQVIVWIQLVVPPVPGYHVVLKASPRPWLIVDYLNSFVSA
jgi:hypothetical protein